MKLQATEHSYYCSESNHYVGNQHGENFGRCEYDTWADFQEEWLDSDGVSIDIDYNLCFRFDIEQKHNPDTDEPIAEFELWLFFMLQRKGIYRPVWIKHIDEKDMPGIKGFLEKQWHYIQYQWNELIEK
ncbi:hypothetical protein [Lacrimispora indolis]|uniref:hypothetical protein n=1 Tax=Lacrimispora indolis TaxID=69825 RepID=UPI00045EC216|nr:hypothetical protein [Lacrimispora indolis]